MTEVIRQSAEALHAPYETFLERAAHESDQAFVEDLYMGAQIAAELQESGGLALAVGGYARDSVLSRINGESLDSKDIDMEVYGLEFDDLVTILECHGRVDLVGSSFGIVKVKNPFSGNMLDFSIPRRDSKVDKGHKGFKVTGDPNMSVEEAARRRDLTVNALALDPLTGELIDHYGGIEDAQAGILRATDPELFKDDPLRVLRVMQFAGRFNFEVEPDTANICRSLDLTELPQERVGQEWLKLMTKATQPSVGLEVARNLGVLEQLHPVLAAVYSSEQDLFGARWLHTKQAVDAAAHITRSESVAEDDKVVVLFSALCADLHRAYDHNPAAATNFLRGLKIPKKLVGKVLPLIDNSLVSLRAPELSDKEVHQFAQRLQPASIRLWDLVSRADTNGHTGILDQTTASFSIYEQAGQLGVTNSPAASIIMGRHLVSHLGLSPGSRFKEILDFLYDAQISGHFSTLEEGVEYYRSVKPHQLPLLELAVDCD